MSGQHPERAGIFVQIPSYRDPELVPTLEDLLSQAAFPDRLHVAVCWQDEDSRPIRAFLEDPRFSVLLMHWRKARGTGWARGLLSRLYRGEAYCLQLDAHHRFAPDWDAQLIASHAALGGGKRLISQYPPPYTLEADGRVVYHPDLSRSAFSGYRTPEGIPILRAARSETLATAPQRARFLSAGFVFGPGCFCREVPNDPELYFQGEEIALSARAYTHGYDFFHLHRALVWHLYKRQTALHHRDRGALGIELNETACRRICQLLGIRDSGVDLGEYGLGSERSLEEYRRFAGIALGQR